MVAESTANAGVRHEKVPEGHAGQRLDNYLASLLTGAPRSVIYKIIRTGQVRVNGGRARPTTRLEPGDTVRIPPVRVSQAAASDVPTSVLERLAAAVLYEDDDHLAIDKPAGIAVHGGSGVRWGLIDALRQLRPGLELELVHRLDRDTSGILLLARNKAAMRRLQAQFREGTPDKRYLCLLDGVMDQPRVRVDQPLAKAERGGERFMTVDPSGKPAVTEFEQLQGYPGSTFAEARLLTGRTHQIRAHAAFIGLPLAGDPRYGSDERRRYWQQRGLRRLFLHAHALTVQDEHGEPLHFSCPLPADLRAFLDSL